MNIREWFRRWHRRAERIMRKSGCVCYCPGCKEPIEFFDAMEDSETNYLAYCECGTRSEWNYGLYPFPVLVRT